MMEFKQDDTVVTLIPMKDRNGKVIPGNSLGKVTVVGVALDDDSPDGIEVLFGDDCGKGSYAYYNPTQLSHAYGHPITIEPEDRPAELKKFRTEDPLALAIALVKTLFYDEKVELKDVYVVWFCATLQNWKALVSTNVKDNAYYEVTHNGDKQETYVDRYVKDGHYKIPDEYVLED